MLRFVLACLIGLTASVQTHAQTMTLTTSDVDYQLTKVHSDVDVFNVNVEINAPLAAGVYVDPEIINVTYQVMGVLTPGTPSGFPAFDLQRNISGTEFYAQGSSLSFEIAQSAVLSDGVQAAELVGNAVILTFNAREIGTGRFHPPILQLDANGTGRIQNSNNEPTLDPVVEVLLGAEYITDLAFDPGNTTLIIETPVAPNPPPNNGGGGASAPSEIIALSLLGACAGLRRRRKQMDIGGRS